MVRNPYVRLFLIFVIVFMAIWVDTRNIIIIPDPFNAGEVLSERDVSPRLGLDLRGGLQVVMEADLPADTPVDSEQMDVARQIIESRTNALGVSENSIQVAGERRLVGEFPGLKDTSSVLSTLQKTGLLEFVGMNDTDFPLVKEGATIKTDYGLVNTTAPGLTPEAATPTETLAPTPTSAPTESSATPGPTVTPVPAVETIYHTVMTGTALKTVNVTTDTLGGYQIAFTLKDDAANLFADYTGAHINEFLAIVLDKEVISTPVIRNQISGGQGVIEGKFTYAEANQLAIQLRYGSLPIPLKIVETRIIGPTLGEDSLQRSLIAGLIGMIIVLLFMGMYYRLPGLVADIAILIYAAIAFAVFKSIPVTLTLPGIAGFLLSTGSALDANILFFERLKEELRAGRTLRQAIDRGWTRAWPSIRDSNIATLITSGILAWFGKTFGATIVLGFSVTLALGVFISLFAAWFVTRTLLGLVLEWFKVHNYARWFGI